MPFEVLILGSDANAYFMARCFHEAYKRKANLLIKSDYSYTKNSSIVKIIRDEDIWNEEGFLKALETFRKNQEGKKILLISSNETYVQFIAKNKDVIHEQYVYNYPSLDIVNSLITKETFYKTYQNSILEFPKTHYHNDGDVLPDDFTYPIIVKPSNVVMYNHLSFEGKKKIYKIYSYEELEMYSNQIFQGGYTDSLIVQEYIPGDDSHLFDSVVYVGKDKKVKQISFAQIGLQEHAKTMIGNAAVMINGYNQFGGSEEMMAILTQFMETIGYQGFAEFDMKYDARDGKFKVLEINARQGRSSYYITPLGFNLVQTLVEELIEGKTLSYTRITEEGLLSFVPKKIIKQYVVNEEFKKKALELWKKGKRVHPLHYWRDFHPRRIPMLFKIARQYLKDYKYGDWENK